jgi:antibiotic biosynthesis monooxygenase (ABM) superfamily enzyme
MIRVIIEREIAEELEKYYEAAIAELLDVMANAPGYLAGESLVEIQRPNHYVVVTRWANEDAWNRWFHSRERQEVADRIRPFMQQEERILVLRQVLYQREEK